MQIEIKRDRQAEREGESERNWCLAYRCNAVAGMPVLFSVHCSLICSIDLCLLLPRVTVLTSYYGITRNLVV